MKACDKCGTETENWYKVALIRAGGTGTICDDCYKAEIKKLKGEEERRR